MSEIIRLFSRNRNEIMQRARRIKQEMEQIFLDAEYWNSAVRKPEERPIDPDPNGTLRRALNSIDEMLQKAKP